MSDYQSVIHTSLKYKLFRYRRPLRWLSAVITNAMADKPVATSHASRLKNMAFGSKLQQIELYVMLMCSLIKYI
jgi:hypothetical protein